MNGTFIYGTCTSTSKVRQSEGDYKKFRIANNVHSSSPVLGNATGIFGTHRQPCATSIESE